MYSVTTTSIGRLLPLGEVFRPSTLKPVRRLRLHAACGREPNQVAVCHGSTKQFSSSFLKATSVGLTAFGLQALPALATDVDGNYINQLLTWFVFAVAVLGLAVITLGVAYLSLKGWMDSQTEEEERKNYERTLANRKKASEGGEDSNLKSEAGPNKQKVAAKQKRGFGSP